ncbi:D-aminoacyl-tRNA deacylase [Psychroflexus planctonicus]|uniref:D-aminoacyl-tRNA deacylase n=1 Tax=Psychroflexus planctonicus TaxID=1526575 RepID=A0ABQ1SE54_9FLAO|nr:D-aminoacyl-tRNA deacylase [Psychroflexus planctonicus]GGE30040.1 D-aminoacyl-tRNA deacylase [Psychroflexus planctonicus]
MRIIIQRVSQAKVEVDQDVIGNIGQGLLVLLGIENEDTQEDIEWLSRKLVNMRIFSDEASMMNKSCLDVNGELLVVSQFTLHASTKKGNRPSFIKAAKPEKAEILYNQFVNHLKENYSIKIETGQFGAMMNVSLVNDGPVTLFIDSKQKE